MQPNRREKDRISTSQQPTQESLPVIMNPLSSSPLTQIHTADIASIQHTILEKKKHNIDFLLVQFQNHHNYYHEHIKLLSHVEEAIEANIRKTKLFSMETYQYFDFLRDSYRPLLKSLSKPSTTFPFWGESQTKTWYEHMCEGMKGLKNVNSEVGYSVSQLVDWCEGAFLPQLKKAMEYYEEPLKGYWSVLKSKRDGIKASLSALEAKFERIRKNSAEMLSNVNYKGDLLFEELQFVVICRKFREDVREWGRAVRTYWETMKGNEASLLDSVKRDIETFFIEIQKVHRGSQKHQQVRTFWATLNVQEEVTTGYSFDRLIKGDSLQFLTSTSKHNTTQSKLMDLITLQRRDEIIDSLQDFIAILTFKTFKCKTDRDRAEVLIYSSVDSNLIFASQDTSEPLFHLILNSVFTRRINQYTVEVNQFLKGFLIDGERREVLHFSSQDQVEEFVFYLNGMGV